MIARFTSASLRWPTTQNIVGNFSHFSSDSYPEYNFQPPYICPRCTQACSASSSYHQEAHPHTLCDHIPPEVRQRSDNHAWCMHVRYPHAPCNLVIRSGTTAPRGRTNMIARQPLIRESHHRSHLHYPALLSPGASVGLPSANNVFVSMANNGPTTRPDPGPNNV